MSECDFRETLRAVHRAIASHCTLADRRFTVDPKCIYKRNCFILQLKLDRLAVKTMASPLYGCVRARLNPFAIASLPKIFHSIRGPSPPAKMCELVLF